MKKFIRSSYFLIILAILYVPIAVMILFSFNSGASIDVFNGWSTKWYGEFIKNSPFIKSIITSLFVAITSTLISLVIGLMAVIGLSRLPKRRQNRWVGIANIPLINADVITAVSLMVVFLLVGVKFGIVTLIAAHVSFNVPYVIITVMPFLRRVDKNLIAASQDLGSSYTQTLFRVILPILRPAIISAAVICFATSFDDFIISYFTSGEQTNVSTFIYTAKRVQPYINAFGTILVAFIFVAIILWNIFKVIQQKHHDEKIRIKNGEYKLKKINKIKKEIERIESEINTKTRIRFSRNLSLWWRYFILKEKLKYLKNRNFNNKISKLEWKKELLVKEIRSEKRIFASYANAQKKQTQLNAQLLKNPHSHRAARFENALKKLDKKMVKLEREIEWINEQRELAAEKVETLTDIVNSLKTELANIENVTKKDVQWYMKRINHYTIKRNIWQEEKANYKLRTTIEKLNQLKTNNLENIQVVYEELKHVEELVFKTVPLTEKIDHKIALLQDHAKTSEVKTQLEVLQHERTTYLDDKIAALKWEKLENEEKLKLIDVERQRLYNKYFSSFEQEHPRRRSVLQRSWKGATLTVLVVGSFATLTTAYVLNNSFDLIVGNWGSYIDMSLISEFEKENNVTINYQQYDSNESLYNKSRTMSYDIMVPSDYMVQRMTSEDALTKIDWSRISGFADPTGKVVSPDATDKMDDTLKGILKKDSTEDFNMLDYVMPYFWGDVRVVFNMQHEAVRNFVQDEGLQFDEQDAKIEGFSWNQLWTAANKKLTIDLSEDAKNLFMIGSKSLGFGVEPTVEQIPSVAKKLKTLLTKSNVSLLGDQLINQIGDGKFDIAVAYNGDILYGEQMAMHLDDDDDTNDITTQVFASAIPVEGTNVWSDNMVINKSNCNLDLSYKFINFIYQHSIDLARYVGYPVASDNVMQELLKSDYKDFKFLFTPTGDAQSGHFTFNEKRDNAIVDEYNRIIASKN